MSAVVTRYSAIEFLGSQVNFDIPRKTITGIMLLRGVECDALVPDCDKDALRLCHADMIRWFLSGPSKRNNTSDSHNGWSHAGGGYELSSEDRKTLLAAANAIYSELEPGSVIGKKRTFVVNSFGVMRGKVGMIDNASGFVYIPHEVK